MKQSANENATCAYDYLFVGLGAANSLLILSLYENGLLDGTTIAIIDPSSKFTDDRTFCFWSTHEELIALSLEELVSASWDHIEIAGITKQNIHPLKYYHIRGIDLSNKTKEVLSLNQVTFYPYSIGSVEKTPTGDFAISTGDSLIHSAKVFDSRPPIFLKSQQNHSHIYQSFFGWKIKTSKKVFDTSSMVMMDFKIPQRNATQFIYILPFEEDVALVELTRFGENKLSEEESIPVLQKYVEDLGSDFEIMEREVGIIPMASGKIEVTAFGHNWIPMGTRANLLKCSTGYAFHAMAEDALVQMEAIKANQVSVRKSRKLRFLFYDRLLLKLLSKTAEQGKNIFETLFKNVPTVNVLKFMREKTKFTEELLIFSKLPKRIFIEAAIKDVVHEIFRLPIIALPIAFTVITILFSRYNLEFISWGVIGLGFLTIGLAHGALDHLTSEKIVNSKQLFYFIIGYLSKATLFTFVWWLSSDTGLVIFILFSAWHFGQADFKEWGFKEGLSSFLWGLVVLMIILFFHRAEFINILQQIPNLSYLDPSKMPGKLFLGLQIVTVTGGLFLALLYKSKHILLTIVYLVMASMLPLLMAFGIYFVGQHSRNGWKHLTLGLKKSSSTMWVNSLPFTLGGAFIIFYFLWYASENYIGLFFIILSCLSLPHVFSMHNFYKLFSTKK